jgi:orotidine-5'-phosphate decarboxylase
MTLHFADKWFAACGDKGAPVCVGLDPVLDRLPTTPGDPIVAIEKWCREILDAVAPFVPAVKPQLACFERYGSQGMAVYERIVNHAHQLGLLVIADAKRGDIGLSSDHYAAAFFDPDHAADALTVSAYLGPDTLQPVINAAAKGGQGLFALVRTSNPGSDAFQSLKLADGRTVSEAMANIIATLGNAHVGDCGYSLLGAVVGATKPEDAVELRSRMPEQIFLVPGFGAQGGSAKDVKACFDANGQGAIITASRSVIFAANVADAARQLRDDIAALL